MRIRGGVCRLTDGSWSVIAELWAPDGSHLEIEPQDGSAWPTFATEVEAEAFYVKRLRPAVTAVLREARRVVS